MKIFGVNLRERASVRDKSAVIVDIDGTIANTEHREHFLGGPKKDWDSFFAACDKDSVYPEIRFLVRAIRMTEIHIFFCTGRPAKYYALTDQWFDKGFIPYSNILMRSDGDYRPDSVVKREMLEFIRANGFRPILSIDDRPEVVAMWRDNDVPCLQVDPVTWKRKSAVESTEKDPVAWLKQMADIPGADPMYAKCLETLTPKLSQIFK